MLILLDILRNYKQMRKTLSILLGTICLSAALNAEDPGVLLQWHLDTEHVLELNEYHKVHMRVLGREIRREDKNKIVVRPVSCDREGCEVHGYFDTYTRFPETDPAFRKDETFDSIFVIRKDGKYVVSDKYVMPNLRSLPSFSDKPIQPGDMWTKPATESFDFKSGRIRITVQAKYIYKGIDSWEYENQSGTGHRIEYTYTMVYEDPKKRENLPYKIMGVAKGIVFFDSEKGVPEYKKNQLSYTFVYTNGFAQESNFEINGVYHLRRKIGDSDQMEMANQIREKLKGKETVLEDSGPLGDVDVREAEDGVTISLNAVLFDHDSSELKPEAMQELGRIAEVLKAYPDKEIRISGHTDNTGSTKYNQELSEERALSVLQSLRDHFGIPEKRLSYKGFGMTRPIQENTTPEGRQANRRVEITLITQ